MLLQRYLKMYKNRTGTLNSGIFRFERLLSLVPNNIVATQSLFYLSTLIGKCYWHYGTTPGPGPIVLYPQICFLWNCTNPEFVEFFFTCGWIFLRLYGQAGCVDVCFLQSLWVIISYFLEWLTHHASATMCVLDFTSTLGLTAFIYVAS